MALDLVLVNCAFLLAIVPHRVGWNIHAFGNGFHILEPEVLFFLCYSGFIVVIFEMNRLYQINVYLSGTLQARLILKSLVYSTVGIVLLSFLTKSDVIVDSRLVLFLFLVFGFVFLVVGRIIIFRSLFRFSVHHGLFPRSILIVGAGSTGSRLAANLVGRNGLGLRVVGFLDDHASIGTEVSHGVKVIGRIEDVATMVDRCDIQEIVICLEDNLSERYLQVVDLCAATRAWVMVGSEQFSTVPRLTYHERYGDVPVFGVAKSAPRMTEPLLKRIADPVFAILILLMLSPLLILVAAAIKLGSPGPVLYRQVRLGMNGRPFMFYKFRSMQVGSDRDRSREEKLKSFIQDNKGDSDSSTKIVDERKVTKVGRVIRKTSIDELPQLLNVVKGDMSLVGPRPCLPYEWSDYAEWHKRRLIVMPGCTGVWQVLGRSRVGFRDMVVLDLFYTYNISFHLDAWLVLKTIPVMLFGKGGQ